jgi:hypothetical protein
MGRLLITIGGAPIRSDQFASREGSSTAFEAETEFMGLQVILIDA